MTERLKLTSRSSPSWISVSSTQTLANVSSPGSPSVKDSELSASLTLTPVVINLSVYYIHQQFSWQM